MMKIPQFVTTILTRYKLRNSILIGYCIPIVLSLLTAILVYTRGVLVVDYESQQLDRLHTNMEAVNNLAFSIANLEKAGRGYLLGQRQNELEDYEYWDFELYTQAESVRALIKNREQQQTLKQIIAVGDRMNELYRRLISYQQLGKPNKAQQVWQQGEVQAITQNLSELVTAFEQEVKTQLEQEQGKQNAALRTLTILVFSIAGLSGVIAISLGLLIAMAISQQMQQATTLITSTSVEIASTIAQQEQNSSQQAAAVSQTTTTLDELNASLHSTEEQTNLSATQANQALDLSDQGKLSVQQTLSGLENLQLKVDEIQQHSEQLGVKSAQIENITQVVRELANQTNMLALNASIEAVRAGEKGRGFGVVAGEIRKLADESTRSAQRIDELITEIRQEIDTSARATETGTQTVAAGVATGQAMANAFGGVSDSVQSVVVNNKKLALNATQQAQAMQQILTAMQDINQAAQNNSLGLTQVRGGMQQLNEALRNLEALM